MEALHKDLQEFIKFAARYFQGKILATALKIESLKNFLVDILMARRIIYQKRAWHVSMVGLSAFGIITAGLFGGESIISTSFPGLGGQDPRFAQAFRPQTDDPVLNSLYDTHTNISQKPRDKIEEYEVKSGDTISTIAEKFSIGADTIKWANDLDNVNSITPGQKLKILPVSGVSHIVKSGDTLESVAKLYSAEAQAILDFPFNDVPDDFKLKVGQLLIIPDGSPPEVTRPVPKASSLATGPKSATFFAPGGGSFIWPTLGGVTQYFAWYHPGLDIANHSGPQVVASDGGIVAVAGWPDSWGFGNRVVINHGNGYQTTYAHLANIYVSVGQNISRGQLVGQMGSTGRSTGTHLHFEIRYKGIAVNPLAILK